MLHPVAATDALDEVHCEVVLRNATMKCEKANFILLPLQVCPYPQIN